MGMGHDLIMVFHALLYTDCIYRAYVCFNLIFRSRRVCINTLILNKDWGRK